MNVTIVDYQSGNISSVINSFTEVAEGKVNIEVTSDIKKIKHSYEFIPEDKSVISATTDYSSKIVCSIERYNLFGTQFHPEKSDKTGLKIIENFIKL